MLKLFAARRGTSRKNNKNKRTRERTARIESLEIRSLLAVLPWGPMQGGTPNYFGPEPNWAYSPQPTVDPVAEDLTGGIHKFVDSLAGLTAANANNLGQYISIAVADTTTFPGSDYYEIALVEFAEKMHTDLNPTVLRGYVQVETPVNAATSAHVPLTYLDDTPLDSLDNPPIVDRAGNPVFGYDEPHYLGATIVATKDTPVRIKFTNYLPTGEGGDLFIPVDTTVMGSGVGPNMIMPMHTHYNAGDPTVSIHAMEPHNLSVGSLVKLEGFTPAAYNGEFRVVGVSSALSFQVTLKTDPGDEATVLGNVTEMYTDNRATLHLHGGDNPWISDGTQHQWITPYGEVTNYDKGASAQNVPDMPDPGDGSMTFFWPNNQSSRLMFYHDHAFGITRLNVYAGEAAGYVLTDAVEQDLIARGVLPDIGIPLVIQDKSFVDPTTILTTDPTWPLPVDDALSNLWMGHVFMPAEDPNVLDGVSPMGRWLYGPWQWPPFPVDHLVIHSVTSILVTNGGSKYDPLDPPTVTITHPLVDGAGNPINGVTRQPAIAQAVVNPLTGKVTALNVIDGGSYEGEPVITIEAPPDPTGTTATAFAVTYQTPNVPDVSMTPEAFMDTAVVNGTAYPYLDVDPKAYRFRILNAADDRFFNLQLVEATSIISSINLTDPGAGYTRAPSVRIGDYLLDGTTPGPGIGAKAVARLEYDPITGLKTGRIAGIEMLAVGSGYVNPQITLVGGTPTTPATAAAEVYSAPTEVGMVEFAEFQPDGTEWPAGWPTPDHRMGGIPDPNKLGPQMIQIGTEGGFLPAPVVFDNIPLGWDLDNLSITVNNVKEHNLFLGCAERADVVVDFSQFAGKTLILYSDTPAPVPAGDPRVDYYTGDPDQSGEGGSVSTLPGYGPNVRTLMQIRVRDLLPGEVVQTFDLQALQNEFKTTATTVRQVTFTSDPTGTGATAEAAIDPITGAVTGITLLSGGSGYTSPTQVAIALPGDNVGTGFAAEAVIDPGTGAVTGVNLVSPGSGYGTLPGVFARGQDPIIVPQAPYNEAYGGVFPELTTAYERIDSNSLTFRPLDLTTRQVGDLATEAVTINNKDKAIIEEWSTEWGRIQTFLGVEVPFTNSTNQTSLWFTVQDPVTEILTDSGDVMSPLGSLGDGTQIWKIAHNGVDTHPIHFHLFNVQLVNRIDWAGFIKPPEPNEMGWKETVRMNPLETAVVAFRPVAPKVPFGQPDSIRLLDPTMPLGATAGFKPFDANGDPVAVVNDYYNFGWEYVWHCHILSHEEMDMMRPIQLNVARALAAAPLLTRIVDPDQVHLFWTDGTPLSDPATWGNPANEVGYRIERAQIQPNGQPDTYINLGSALANATDFIDGTFDPAFAYRYRVIAFNAAGDSTSNVVIAGLPPFVTSYSLVADTGLSSTDQITNDTTPALTFVFNKVVLGTNAAVTVTRPGGATVTPNSIVGWGTNTLTIAFTATALTNQGQYTVRLDGTTPSAITEGAGIPLNGGVDEVRNFTIDTAGPTAAMVAVTPDPRTTAVDSIAIVFNEAVGGVSLAGLSLTLNGAPVFLASATLSTANNVTWTLGNLTALTGTLVNLTTTAYNLSLTGAGSGITDVAGNALTGNASDAWVLNPSTFTGTLGNDTYDFIAAGGAGGLPTMHQLRVKFTGGPAVTYLYDATGSISLTVNAGAGSDTITVTGGPGVDSSTINRYTVDHLGPGTAGSPGYYRVSASSVETIVDNADAGTGQNVIFYDGPDNGDRFTAYAQLRNGSMRSAGNNPNAPGFFNNSAAGYDQISGAAPNGGTGDTATLYDSDGNDLFVSDASSGSPQSSIQRVSGGTGTPALVSAGVGFETVTGSATNGGVDQAVLYGSSGNDSMNVQPALNRAYLTVPGSYFIWALNFKGITAYPGAGTDAVAFFDTAGNDTFTASPTQAQMAGPAGSNILNIAASDPANSTYLWDTVRAYATTSGYDKAYLTGSTGNDTFLGYGKPRATNPGLGRLSGTGYFLEVYQFEEVYANLLTGSDTANLFDGSANDYFWGQLGAAVLTDGTVDNATGNLVTPGSYYYSVTGFDNPLSDRVNLSGTSGGTNTRKVITPLDYLLATNGSWIDAP